jgi:hypothetical protein
MGGRRVLVPTPMMVDELAKTVKHADLLRV